MLKLRVRINIKVWEAPIEPVGALCNGEIPAGHTLGIPIHIIELIPVIIL
jgi:hypothetical protein